MRLKDFVSGAIIVTFGMYLTRMAVNNPEYQIYYFVLFLIVGAAVAYFGTGK